MILINSQTAREALKQYGDTMEAARALGVTEADIWNSLPAEASSKRHGHFSTFENPFLSQKPRVPTP